MNKTVYNERYKSKPQYWGFTPSSMAYKILELLPPLSGNFKVLDIGCGEGATAVFLAKNGYDVTAFDLAESGIIKTKENAKKHNVQVNALQADINEYKIKDNYDVIFSSGTLQYLFPENRKRFVDSMKDCTNKNGINVLHTFVSKPFVEIAPDAEENEHLWLSGELLNLYHDWETVSFVEEIKSCNSSGISHRHAHNRIWTIKTV